MTRNFTPHQTTLTDLQDYLWIIYKYDLEQTSVEVCYIALCAIVDPDEEMHDVIRWLSEMLYATQFDCAFDDVVQFIETRIRCINVASRHRRLYDPFLIEAYAPPTTSQTDTPPKRFGRH